MGQLELSAQNAAITIEIKQYHRIVARAPLEMKNKDILRFVDEKQAWIEGHLQIARTHAAEKTLFKLIKLKKFALWRMLLRKISPGMWQSMLQSSERHQRKVYCPDT